ncbi:MAG TPA: DUF4129 domain-containing protein, partial [Acidimicrobiales bacterium]
MLPDLPPPEHDPAEVRRIADEILDQSRYDVRTNPLQSAADWVAEQLARLVGPLGVGSVPVWVGWVVLGLLVAAVAWVVVRAARTFTRDVRPDRPTGTVVVDAGERAVDWAAEAARHEAAGRWHEALRCRYRVLVGELARRNVIPDLVGRTAGEYVADVRANRPAAAGPFAAATGLFETVWYGGAPAG